MDMAQKGSFNTVPRAPNDTQSCMNPSLNLVTAEVQDVECFTCHCLVALIHGLGSHSSHHFAPEVPTHVQRSGFIYREGSIAYAIHREVSRSALYSSQNVWQSGFEYHIPRSRKINVGLDGLILNVGIDASSQSYSLVNQAIPCVTWIVKGSSS